MRTVCKQLAKGTRDRLVLLPPKAIWYFTTYDGIVTGVQTNQFASNTMFTIVVEGGAHNLSFQNSCLVHTVEY